MPTATKIPLASITLSSDSAVTFSSISQSYTDLILVIGSATTDSSTTDIDIRLNGDNGGNYSGTGSAGSGGTGGGGSGTSQTTTGVAGIANTGGGGGGIPTNDADATIYPISRWGRTNYQGGVVSLFVYHHCVWAYFRVPLAGCLWHDLEAD